MLSGGRGEAMRSAMRSALQLLLLLGSLPCRGVAAAASPLPSSSPTMPSVTTASTLAATRASGPSATPPPVPEAPTSRKPTALPASARPVSPTLSGPLKMLTTETSVSSTTLLSTRHGAFPGPGTAVAEKITPWAPTPAPGSSPASSTASGGGTSKDTAFASKPSPLSLSPTSPSAPRPVGSTGKSPGPLSVPTSVSPLPGMSRGATTLGSVTTAKDETTSKDKLSALTPSPATGISKTTHRLLATTVANTAGSPKSPTVATPSSSVSSHPDRRATPLAASTEASEPRLSHVPSSSSRPNLTSVQAGSKIVCETRMPPKDQAIILTLNESKPCHSLEGSPLKEALMATLCRAVKANFNQSRDECTARLASDTEDPKRLAVVGVSVQTNSVDEELSEALAAKKTELGKLGVNNITHGGRPLDTDPKDHFSLPLIITIICMAASLLLVAAIYGCCHQRISQRKDQQRLTEELHTIENGYHDNPTLEVMETLSEMQEKKVNLNGELGDSWIVPMESLTKDDLDEEEDTHL